MALYRVGSRGLKVLRTDHTYVEYPAGQVVAFAVLPTAYEGELTEIKADPKHGAYEDKSRRAKEDKAPMMGPSLPPSGGV
jgi:hypothetical protein